MLHTKRLSTHYPSRAAGALLTTLLMTTLLTTLGCGGLSLEGQQDAGQADSDTGQADSGQVGSDTGLPSDVELGQASAGTFVVASTGQQACYDTAGAVVGCPSEGQALAGQDAQYGDAVTRYRDNGDGTVSDLATGLLWQQDPGPKVSWEQAFTNAAALSLGDCGAWRVPNITELYSLMDFSGVTGLSEAQSTPYLDTDVFAFEYGDTSAGERMIDAQFWSSSEYVSTTMNGDQTVFGVNFADGRIKGYPVFRPPVNDPMPAFIRFLCAEPPADHLAALGSNDFADAGDGTVVDFATGLTWTRQDSGGFGAGDAGDGGLNWEQALAFCEALSLAGADDWRLPDAKELQGIVDYTRSPATTDSAAINQVFEVTAIIDEGGGRNFPFFWTSTTHVDGLPGGSYAVYVAFGEALGFMEAPPNSGRVTLLDVHGAGAQRSDPKTGDAGDYPQGHGPQGDVVRIYNHARCVRGGL